MQEKYFCEAEDKTHYGHIIGQRFLLMSPLRSESFCLQRFKSPSLDTVANCWNFLQEELSKHGVSKALSKNISGDSAHMLHLVSHPWLLLFKGRLVGVMGSVSQKRGRISDFFATISQHGSLPG